MKTSQIYVILATTILVISFACSLAAISLSGSHNDTITQTLNVVTARMDKIDSMINNLFGVKTTQEIRDAVRDMRAEHTHLDKKQTVIIIKLEKILEELMRKK